MGFKKEKNLLSHLLFRHLIFFFRFISTIDPSEEKFDEKPISNSESSLNHQQLESMDDNMDDAPPIPIPSGRKTSENDDVPILGSRTWSSHPAPVGVVENQIRLPPPSPLSLPTFPPLIFTFPSFTFLPTLPTSSPINLPNPILANPQDSFKNLFLNVFLPPKAIHPLSRKRRHIDFNRRKHQMNNAKNSYLENPGKNGIAKNVYGYKNRWKRSDYYDDIDDGTTKAINHKLVKLGILGAQTDYPDYSGTDAEENLVDGFVECIQYL